MSQPVMADAQFGITHILRPFPTFIDSYIGRNQRIPIMFTEGGLPLDPNAGEVGYAPQLVRALPVPLGSRVTIWLPSVLGNPELGGGEPNPYTWTIMWRYRNVFEYRTHRGAYHFPKQAPGVAELGSPRIVKPATYHSVIYNGVAPTPPPGIGYALQTIWPERFTTEGAASTAGMFLPLVPGTIPAADGYVQQGLFDPTAVGAANAALPSYMNVEMTAFGDEMLIGLTKTGTVAWFLSGEDTILSNLFGPGSSPDIGVYVMTGSSP